MNVKGALTELLASGLSWVIRQIETITFKNYKCNERGYRNILQKNDLARALHVWLIQQPVDVLIVFCIQS